MIKKSQWNMFNTTSLTWGGWHFSKTVERGHFSKTVERGNFSTSNKNKCGGHICFHTEIITLDGVETKNSYYH